MSLREQIESYVTEMLEDSTQYTSDGEPNFAYVVGMLAHDLEWALGGDDQRALILDRLERSI